MKLGVGTYTFMWSIGFPGATPKRPMTALGLVEAARGLGAEVIQFGPNLALPDLPDTEREEVVAAIREYGMELEIGTRGVLPTHLLEALEFTRSCGATFLRTVAEVEGGRIPSAQELARSLAEIGDHFAAAGIRLGIENSLMPAEAMIASLADVGIPNLGITLDTVNSLAIPEGTREVAERLAPWTHCLHVKDFVIRRQWHSMGFVVEGRPAGQGQLDIPWITRLLSGHDRHANAIIELWVPEQADLEETVRMERDWAAASVAFMRRHLRQ